MTWILKFFENPNMDHLLIVFKWHLMKFSLAPDFKIEEKLKKITLEYTLWIH